MDADCGRQLSRGSIERDGAGRRAELCVMSADYFARLERRDGPQPSEQITLNFPPSSSRAITIALSGASRFLLSRVDRRWWATPKGEQS